jgi:SAM-dependent methyltransferase
MENANSESLADAWKREAPRWLDWARTPGHDSYWRFHRDQFLAIIPEPGKLTIDVGCGEGRLTRDLKRLGHKTVGFDISESLIDNARQADPDGTYHVCNAENVNLESSIADLAVAFMTPQDIDNVDAAFSEVSRILMEGGRACVAMVHPLNSSGCFSSDEPDAPFVIETNYLQEHRNCDNFSRDGLEMTFHSAHRPLERYSRALERAGLLIELIREHPVPDAEADSFPRMKKWQRLPLFMHFRAIKPPSSLRLLKAAP